MLNVILLNKHYNLYSTVALDKMNFATSCIINLGKSIQCIFEHKQRVGVKLICSSIAAHTIISSSWTMEIHFINQLQNGTNCNNPNFMKTKQNKYKNTHNPHTHTHRHCVMYLCMCIQHYAEKFSLNQKTFRKWVKNY